MQKYESIYIIGESRTNHDNAITKIYGSFYIAFEVSYNDGIILSFACTHTLNLTEEFLRKIFIGKSLEKDYEELESEIASRYYGSSVKAVLVSLKDAHKRYMDAKKKISSDSN